MFNMKNFWLLWFLSIIILLSGCTNKIIDEGTGNYWCPLVIQWVWPEISGEPTVDGWTLVWRCYTEYQTHHIFMKAWMWEKFFTGENEYLPGNTVHFMWNVKEIGAGAGNHYYDVESINTLKLMNTPDKQAILDMFDGYNFCESDDDCTYFMWKCPLGCFVPINKKYENIAKNILDNYFEINWQSCAYNCLYMDKVVCENYKCTMKNDENML